MKKKIVPVILFLVGCSCFGVAYFLANSAEEHDAIGGITNLIYNGGGCIIIILSVIMFFNTKDDEDEQQG